MWALVVAQFFYALGDGFLYPFVVFYLTRDLHLSTAHAGLLMGIAGIGYIAGQLPAAYLSDRFGPRRISVVSYAIAAVAVMTAGLVHTVWVWTLAYGLTLMMVGAAFPAVIHAMTLHVKPEHRTQGYSLLLLSQNAGIIVGPLVGLSLALYQFQWIFWIDAICLVISSLVLTRGIPQIVPARPMDSPRAHVSIWRTWLYFPPWKQSGFWSVALGGTLIGIIYSQLMSTLPMEMEHTVGILRWYGLLWAMNGALITVLQWPVSRVLRHGNRRFWMGLGAILYAAAMILLGMSAEIMLIVAAFVIVTLGELIYEPLPPTEYAAQAPKGYGARYQGAGSFFSAFGMVIGPVLGGVLLADAGHLVLWLAMGACGLIATWLIMHHSTSGTLRSDFTKTAH
ncbi:MAG: MFS transporter [Sulfobacillus thermotolerans]|nr:MFS transporter [Sulfobacillus thermotolerans]